MPTPNNSAPTGALQTAAPEAVHRSSARLQAGCPEDYLQQPSQAWTYISQSATVNPRDLPNTTTTVVNAAASPPATFPSTIPIIPSSSAGSSSSSRQSTPSSSSSVSVASDKDRQFSPTSSISPKLEAINAAAPSTDTVDPTISLGANFSAMRLYPSISSSYLRPSAKFRGLQKNEKQSYKVGVTLQQVDMANSFVCGYLDIEGLTEDHPSLTTYFEGQIIGPRHSFSTRAWGATEAEDLEHWKKFPSFKSSFPYTGPDTLKKAHNAIKKQQAKRDHIYMRWKEHFLVPDHTVTTLNGASFEGFYYICFNLKTGAVEGYYYHANSNKDQQLELKWVEERFFPSLEFR